MGFLLTELFHHPCNLSRTARNMAYFYDHFDRLTIYDISIIVLLVLRYGMADGRLYIR